MKVRYEKKHLVIRLKMKYFDWEGPNVDDRNESIFKQYDLKIYNIYRTRGAQVLETDKGLKLFQNFQGSLGHLEFENCVKEHLVSHGYPNIDLYVRNIEGKLFVEDNYGDKYIVKNWFIGEEANFKEYINIKKAAGNLGKLHNILHDIEFGECKLCYHNFYNLVDIFKKHNRELKRVKGYIREKKQRNEFELCFLNTFDLFYQQGQEALELLAKQNYESLQETVIKETRICHGNYTYHNLLLIKNDIATTSFEKCGIGLPVFDLYQFIRKVMEKSDWNITIVNDIMKEYNHYYQISKAEFDILYIMLLYPEKFWKVTNYYYNNKKSWISQRNIQKLNNIQKQSKIKEKFLQEFFF